MRSRWLNKINIIFSIGLLIILSIGMVSYLNNQRLNAYSKLVVHTDEVLANTKLTLSYFLDIETGMRGFVITGDPSFLEPYDNALNHIEESIQNLEMATSDNPRQQLNIGHLKELKNILIERSQLLVVLRKSKGLLVASRQIAGGEGKRLMDQIRAHIKIMESEERQLLANRVAEAGRYSKISTLVTIAGSIAAAILILLALIVLNRQIREIKRGQRNIQRLNTQLTEKVTALEMSNKELETFSYSVSHDLRAPLRTMIGFSTIILEDHGDILVPEVRDSLGRIISATKKMGQLIDGLLDLSRLSRKEMISEDVNLSSLVDSILNDLRNNDPERVVSFEVTKDLIVKGDSRLLQAALFNLLSNAWKFTKTCKAARIQFGSKQINNQNTFYIKDNGVGFDMTYVSKLFGVFQRLHSSKDYEGTGIGLATVQRIIQRHGGKIWAESQINKGTIFHFTI